MQSYCLCCHFKIGKHVYLVFILELVFCNGLLTSYFPSISAVMKFNICEVSLSRITESENECAWEVSLNELIKYYFKCMFFSTLRRWWWVDDRQLWWKIALTYDFDRDQLLRHFKSSKDYVVQSRRWQIVHTDWKNV